MRVYLKNYSTPLCKCVPPLICRIVDRLIRNRSIGLVFQQFNLSARLTALEDVCLPLVYQGISEREQHRIAWKMLERVQYNVLTPF